MPLPPGDFAPREAPFWAYCGGPEALMVTDGFRPRSPCPAMELVGVLPLTSVCVPTAGTAGGIATLPFIGEFLSDFPYCVEDADGGFAPAEPGGGEKGFLVALA